MTHHSLELSATVKPGRCPLISRHDISFVTIGLEKVCFHDKREFIPLIQLTLYPESGLPGTSYTEFDPLLKTVIRRSLKFAPAVVPHTFSQTSMVNERWLSEEADQIPVTAYQ